MALAYVGLGGNLRRTGRNFRAALREMKKIPSARMTGASRVYVSPPLGCPGAQPDYLNLAARLQTFAPPRRVFRSLRRLEFRVQKRRRRRNAPRVLDADYLAHGAALLRGRTLRLPHPRMGGRAFVLAPLAELTGADFSGMRNAAALAQALPRLTALQNTRPLTRQ